jgi:hypothetical protein
MARVCYGEFLLLGIFAIIVALIGKIVEYTKGGNGGLLNFEKLFEKVQSDNPSFSAVYSPRIDVAYYILF